MQDGKKAGGRGPGRTTRQDWLTAALDTLISEGEDQVKVLSLAAILDCPRSSFYWYFKNRSELMDALLDTWAATNTKALIDAADNDGATICEALAKLFSKWVYGSAFDTKLDFAIRDWARRSGTVRRALDESDIARIAAISLMFERFSYPPAEADVRARIVYFTQIGYATLDQREDYDTRMKRGAQYLFCMTGQTPTRDEIAALAHLYPKTNYVGIDHVL
ncbi:hypothetical protein ASD8599_03793 [Ascidiaceihabitans donghaensis]|uniref:HTH tetR-type domain-containing protein n=1 Tax=Ascidiaceihabitans donghaensis TaxID=1510460 RepID=A0A2R8BP12_9RHOB|nr:TetR/AcrR family transcriptional regulator [Ascidiaceihabitans donghaensis]SPH27327.1 hypothetical protein ASD8599_03793 [Ascidiaceihabitans donghaensis]